MRRPTSIAQHKYRKTRIASPIPQTTVLTRMAPTIGRENKRQRQHGQQTQNAGEIAPIYFPPTLFAFDPANHTTDQRIRFNSGSICNLENSRAAGPRAPGSTSFRIRVDGAKRFPRLKLDRQFCDAEQFQPLDQLRLLSSRVRRREPRRQCQWLRNSWRR